MKTKSIRQNRLVRVFKDINRLNCTENRFCFLIGAGASKSSGIKTGWELSKDWYNDLINDLDDEERFEWENEINFDEDRIGEFYSYLYRKRYESSPQLGYEEFKKLMENIEPGLGYVILAQILAKEKHNFVITTNFDYLIEDAVNMYTFTKPFSAGHETLAEFVSMQTERPTIIKVHRDLFLHPLNDSTETKKLKVEWERALKPILKNFNLLVIGYGGNDGSLMDYLKEIKPSERKAIYWCHLQNENLNSKINDLLTEKDFTVEISGFDELMFALNDAFNYDVFENLDDPTNHPFVLAAKQRISGLNDKRENLLEELKKEDKQISQGEKEVFTGSMKVLLNAYLEENIDKKEDIYLKGLENYPKDTNLIINYALFQTRSRKNLRKAKSLYLKALKLEPLNTYIKSSYAYFLSHSLKKIEEAEELYKQSIEIEPLDPKLICNYATFLYNFNIDNLKAQKMFEKAIEIDPNDPTILGNYANFVAFELYDFNKASRIYRKAIEIAPKDANNLSNYAILLAIHFEEFDEAEKMFIKSINIDSNDSNILNNFAIFLTDIRQNYSKAEELFKKALEIEPNDANIYGNYAHHKIISHKDFEQAEELIETSFIKINNNNLPLLAELWFYRFAHYPKWKKMAQKELDALIAAKAKSVGFNLKSHVEIARENNFSDMALLEEYANKITQL